MSKKEFVVFGLGRFGKSVAMTLAESGCEVLVVDDNAEKIQEVADIVTYAVKANVTDVDTMETLGISNFDGAIVGIGENLEASVMVTILAKELGIPYILAKAQNELHAKILKKVGADMVVFPEKETGIRIAHNLLLGNFFDAVELSSTFSLMDISALNEWDGHTLLELDLRAKYKVNVIGIKKDGVLDINPEADTKVSKNDILVMIGRNEILNKLASMSGR
ncbi:MAG TPA: TrkA family potassium uptake protein [Lachnospiraceae bacterium]|nr:TrkA family potassium uptake protein [Lachnospiraceae bacterium]